MNPDFDTYRLSDEHEALREAVRALAEKEIAPHAAEVDEQGRKPWSRRGSRPSSSPRSTAARGPTSWRAAS
jgi:alkylation response protein AidB-like acyl-CoA dehydrogenase